MTANGSVSRRGFLRGSAGTAALAGASGAAAAQEGGGTTEIQLVDYAFEPGTDEPAQVMPGTEVTFVWETSTHNIVVENQPEEANWEGHEDIEDAGFEYSHTFEVEGTYEFFCQPHRGLGMEGTIEVTPDAGGDGGDGGGGAPAIPDAAKSLGLGLFFAMLTTLGLAYFLLKYGDERREPAE